MAKGKLFVISGPSGTGKGTICEQLLKNDDKIMLSISMTTRKPRQGEVDGESYFFVSRDEFQDKIANKGFIEYAEVFGNFYGTPKKEVMEALDEGRNVILEIDVQGGIQVKENFDQAVLIFILPPSLEELEDRIRNRGSEVEEEIIRRLSMAQTEIAESEKYDYVVINDDLDQAVADCQAIIRAEYLRQTF